MNNKPDIRWLAIGALAGLAAAAVGILRQSSTGEPLADDVVAMVNDVEIGRDVYDRAVERIAPPDADAADRLRILERLIEDELLVQRGVELGITESDSEVRSAIVNSLVASVTSEADASAPTDAELEQYLADNADRFSYTSRLHARIWQADDEPDAQAFVTTLRAGTSADDGGSVQRVPDVPEGLVDVNELRVHLGPAIAAAAADMPAGTSAVFARRGRWLIVEVVEKERAYVTDVSTIRNRLLLDYRRHLADRMLTDYIENLRQRADVRTGDE